MDEGVSAREEEDSDEISSGDGSGSEEDSGVASGLEISSFWPMLACLFKDWGVG